MIHFSGHTVNNGKQTGLQKLPDYQQVSLSNRTDQVHFSGTQKPAFKQWTVTSMSNILQGQLSLHGTNTPKRLNIYKNTPEYTVMDVDFWYDSKRKALVVSHDKPSKDAPLLKDWLKAYANLPKQKRVALQLDMKNKEATQPVIKALNQFKKDHPQAWEDSMIILNGDIPIGKSHRFNLFNFRTWPILFQSKLDLEDMQALSKAFPDTVISLGIASYIKNLDNSLLEAIDTTFKQFSGQGKLICLPASLKISKEAVAQFTQNNMLMKFWSSQSHQYTKPSDGDALRKTIHVPADTPFWVEF